MTGIRISIPRHSCSLGWNAVGGYACQTLLIDYAMSVKDRARQIFLVHGEERAATALIECLGERGLKQTVYPDWHESVEI